MPALAQDFRTAPASVLAAARVVARAADSAPSDGDVAIVRREVGRLASVEPQLVASGLDALLVAPEAGLALQHLASWGVLGALLPEVQAMVELRHEGAHKDLWAHTIEVLQRVAPEPDLRWIALCHDIGKPATRATDEHGKVTFLRHEALGARLVRGIGARLELAPRRVERIAFVVEHHARTNAFDAEWSERALRRLVRDAGSYLGDMLAFSKVDWTSKRPDEAARIRKNLALIERRLAHIAAHQLKWSPPSGLGDALVAARGRTRGPWLGEAIRAIEAAVEAGTLSAEADIGQLVAFSNSAK